MSDEHRKRKMSDKQFEESLKNFFKSNKTIDDILKNYPKFIYEYIPEKVFVINQSKGDKYKLTNLPEPFKKF